MGLTPLEGLVMGTRSGDIDPAILEFIAQKDNLDLAGVMNVLNKKSGVFGLSGGLSSDFRELTDAMIAGDKKAKIAMDVFSYKVAKYIGSYAAAMNGVDDIVFTAGIGENDDYVREMCIRDSFNDGAWEAIAEKAMHKDTGARALRAIIEEFMLDIMYEIPKDDSIGEVEITRELSLIHI